MLFKCLISCRTSVCILFSSAFNRFVDGVCVSPVDFGVIGSGSSAATTSMFLFLKNPKKPPRLISLEFKMTASGPSSLRILLITSGIVGAIYFFTFMQYSPPRHFVRVHQAPTHYRIKRQPEADSRSEEHTS